MLLSMIYYNKTKTACVKLNHTIFNMYMSENHQLFLNLDNIKSINELSYFLALNLHIATFLSKHLEHITLATFSIPARPKICTNSAPQSPKLEKKARTQTFFDPDDKFQVITFKKDENGQSVQVTGELEKLDFKTLNRSHENLTLIAGYKNGQESVSDFKTPGGETITSKQLLAILPGIPQLGFKNEHLDQINEFFEKCGRELKRMYEIGRNIACFFNGNSTFSVNSMHVQFWDLETKNPGNLNNLYRLETGITDFQLETTNGCKVIFEFDRLGIPYNCNLILDENGQPKMLIYVYHYDQKNKNYGEYCPVNLVPTLDEFHNSKGKNGIISHASSAGTGLRTLFKGKHSDAYEFQNTQQITTPVSLEYAQELIAEFKSRKAPKN